MMSKQPKKLNGNSTVFTTNGGTIAWTGVVNPNQNSLRQSMVLVLKRINGFVMNWSESIYQNGDHRNWKNMI
ncbi:MAG: hypothetical protein HQM13_07055 [SAR324 cluster bacterium]|nr:hypothetical protein [SAR324 cluster bacterium]